MKRIFALAGLAVLTVASVSSAQNTAVIAGGPHDLSNGSAVRNTNATINGQTCVFCHVAHGGANSIPLWNRNSPTGATYQLYTSSTSDATTTGANVAGSVSGTCMSCHDGTMAMDVLINVNGLPFSSAVAFTKQANGKSTYGSTGGGSSNLMNGGLPYIGTDLRNDHPVSIVYETARAGNAGEYVSQVVNGVKITVGASGPLPLFGASSATATIECASCHNPHNNSLGNFLRKANTGSAICLTCHIK
ncbi:MAG: cytochrome c3 family protein [Acidobacteriota bacterium]